MAESSVTERVGRTFTARQLMEVPCDKIWSFWGKETLEKFYLVFDDGEVVTNVARTALCRYLWEILRDFPEVEMSKKFHFTSGYPSVDTTRDILSAMVRRIHEVYDHDFNYEELWRTIYKQINHLYNDGIVEMEPYQAGGTALDMLEVYDHPIVAKANREVQAGEISVKVAQDIIHKTIMTSPDLEDNHYVRLARSGCVKIEQFVQIIGPRGNMTDINSSMFRYPITRGYFQGIISLHDSLIESRSAVKSLYFNKKPLRDVEYFNRKMQLLCTVVHTLRYDDCETDGYLEFKVDSNLFKGAEGANFFDEEKKVWRPMMIEDRQKVIGKVTKIRSPMFCRYRGNGQVCIKCFGEIGWSIPYKTNLGHVSSTEMCQEGSQLVLSVKHYDGSAVAIDINISEYESRFIRPGTDTGTIRLNPLIKGYNPVLMLESRPKGTAEGASGISDIRHLDDLNNMSPYRLTSFNDAVIELENEDGGFSYETVSVCSGPRLGSLTPDFVRYALSDHYTIGNDGFYHVDLSDWDFDLDVFTIPLKHINMLDYMSEIESFLRSSSDNKKNKMISKGKRLVEYTSAQEALLDLYDMTSQRLSVNIAHLGVILLALMRSAEPNNYRLPKYGEPAKFETHTRLMEGRSHGQLMFYEGQPKALVDVSSYMQDNRPAGILDKLLML